MSNANNPMIDAVHVMVDIETLGTTSEAVVMSIGACAGVLKPDGMFGLTYYEELDVAFQANALDRVVDGATMAWWREQLNSGTKWPGLGMLRPKDCKRTFEDWFSGVASSGANVYVWANGTDFDIGILKSLWGTLPWKYNAVRDFRTLASLYPQFCANSIVSHHALDDAVSQWKQLYTCLMAHFELYDPVKLEGEIDVD